MRLKVGNTKQAGFTIVELLIVVVVIAILAAITIVSYNGITARANESAVKSELSQNAKSITNAASIAGGKYTTSAVMNGGNPFLKYTADRYKVVTYCTNGTEFVLAAETKAGKKYYSRSNNVAPVNNDSIDAFLPCSSLSVAGADTTYTNLPAQCANQGGSCAVTGTATAVYGSDIQGLFSRKLNSTGTVACEHATFGGDPAVGFGKSCYIYPN
jgi:prepilin-type N-terminal cleavage/methylation domain-containing protein